MAAITITALSYDADTDLVSVACDFSALDAIGPDLLVLHPAAIGNRIAVNGCADGDEALTAIVLEHAARVAPDAADVTVDWRSPSDEEKASQLDALADPIEAARVFFS